MAGSVIQIVARRIGCAALAVIATSLGTRAQEPPLAQAAASATLPPPASPAIPLAEWNDDWWYPEGALRIGGERYSVFAGATVRRFTHVGSAAGVTVVEPEIDLYRPGHKGLQLDLDLTWAGIAQRSSVARFIAPTLGVRRTLRDSTRATRFVPFGAVRLGPYFTRTNPSGSATLLGANVTVGVEVARLASIAARYDLMPGTKGTNLSNVSVRVMAAVPFRRGSKTRAKMHDDVPAPGRLIDIGGHRLHLVCRGSGSPTVVFEAGLSDAWVSWARVQPEVARHTRACAYDRAGIGYSDPGPTPRTSDRIATELHALLAAGGIEGPYVLVGHSFGGLTVRVFANRYRDQIAGMVLVDASHPDQAERLPAERRALPARAAAAYLQMATQAERGQAVPPVARNLPVTVASRGAWYRTLYEESRAFDESASQVRATGQLGHLPLIVVSAGRGARRGGRGDVATRQQRAWALLQTDLVTLSTQGTQRIADKSRHYVQQEAPQLVIEAILAIVRNSRGLPSTPVSDTR